MGKGIGEWRWTEGWIEKVTGGWTEGGMGKRGWRVDRWRNGRRMGKRGWRMEKEGRIEGWKKRLEDGQKEGRK